MNIQVNNPLYQQFVELVSVASADVIEGCVQPLSESLSNAQREISKIQKYADDLGQQYIDIEKVVDTTANRVLKQTVQPLLIGFNDINSELSLAAREIIGIQKIIDELKLHSIDIKDKNKVLNEIVFTATTKIFDDLIGPIQQELAQTIPPLKEGSVALLKLEKGTEQLSILLDKAEKRNQEVLDKMLELKKEIRASQESLQRRIETLVGDIQTKLALDIDRLNSTFSSKMNELELAQIGRTQMSDTYIGGLKSRIESMSNVIDYQQNYLEKKLKQQQYGIWGLWGIAIIILIIICLPLFK